MKSRSSELRRARPLLGTIVEIGARGPGASAGIEAAFREVETIHQLMSFHEIYSDVSCLNRAPLLTPLAVDPRTYEVLTWAQRISALSEGAFDVTVGAELVAAGFLPEPANSEYPFPEANFRDLSLLPDNRVLLKRRAWIDLGGIAKGYAVDRAVMMLKQFGVVSGTVNAGGDLLVFGAEQPVHIRHPGEPGLKFPLGKVLNSAVASSSGCFSAREKIYAVNDPLIDPRRNRRVNWRFSVTVIAACCIVADALTKVVRLAIRQAPRILSQFGARALIIDRRGLRIFPANENDTMSSSLETAARVVNAETRASIPHQAVTGL